MNLTEITKKILSACIGWQLGLLLVGFPLKANSIEFSIKPMSMIISSGRVSAIDTAQKIKWFEQNQRVESSIEIGAKYTLSGGNRVEYKYQSLNMVYGGQFAKEACSFFGCAYVGPGAITGYQAADNIKIIFDRHSIGHSLKVDKFFANFLLYGIDLLSVGATASGLNFLERRELIVPVPKFGINTSFPLSSSIDVMAMASHSELPKNNNSIKLKELEFSFRYPYLSNSFLELGYQRTSFAFDYGNRGKNFAINTSASGPFLKIVIKF